MNVLADNEKAAAGYVLVFFNEIEQLTHESAAFQNVLKVLAMKYPGEQGYKKMDDMERKQLQESINLTRYYCARTFIKLTALKNKIPELGQNYKEIKETKEKILSDDMPTYPDVEKYVIQINTLFVAGIMSELLTKAQDIYKQYAGGQNG